MTFRTREKKFGLDELREVFPTSRFISGCMLSWVSVSSVKIGLGACRDDSDTLTIKAMSEITIDIATAGKNGLDIGSEASNTWYYVWLIYNPTTKEVAGLISLSSTNPTVPSGFTLKRRMGSVRNDFSSNLLKFKHFECGRNRRYLWLEDVNTTLRVLTNGGATTYTDVSLEPRISPMAYLAHLLVEASKLTYVRPDGETMSGWFKILASNSDSMEIPMNSSIVEYRTDNGGSVNMAVMGYQEEVE